MINQETFEKLLEIGGATLAQKVIDLFFEHTPKKVASLPTLLENGDLKSLERMAHSIKSSAANLGLDTLREVSAKLELAANQGQLKPVTNWFPSLSPLIAKPKQCSETSKKNWSPHETSDRCH